MTLRARLALGIFTIGLVLLVPLLLATRSLENIANEARELKEREYASTLFLGRVRSATDDFLASELALGVDTTAEALRAAEHDLDRLSALVDSLPRIGLANALPGADTVLVRVRDYARREHAAAAMGRGELADTISADSLRPLVARLSRGVRTTEGHLAASTGRRVDATAKAVAEAQQRTATAFAVAALLATLVAVALTYAISRPVRDLEEGMARVADGEFEHRLRITRNRHDEFGRLAESYDRMTHQLATLDRLKAEFISVASHELKTPINVIMGYVQLLQEGVFGELTDKQREINAILEAQCQTLSRLVRQLLDISRFEAGGGKLDLRPFVLPEFLEDLERAFAVLAHQREVDFSVRAAPDVPERVTWDADRINEVLGNLLANAFKFTPRGGRVELVVEANGDGVHLEVRDTGAGISAEQLPRIFDKFYQADNQQAAAAKGTGLGLAIAKSIVEAHGGTIGCDSTPGVGTTFSIDLPQTANRHGMTPRVSAPQVAIR